MTMREGGSANPRPCSLPDERAEATVDAFLTELAAALRSRKRRQGHLPDFRPAAVLIPLVRRPEGLFVTFLKRAEDGRVHSGQIAFPGGAWEKSDADATATALREAEEEVNIPPSSVTPLGWMDDNATISQYLVTPVVGVVSPPPRYALDPKEAQAVFEVPLVQLLDPANERRAPDAEFLGRRWALYEYRFEEHLIWGVTGRILYELLTVARSLSATQRLRSAGSAA